MKVEWSELAFVRLGEIEDFVGRRDPEAGIRIVERLIARAETLAEQPLMGRAVPELPFTALRELVEAPYRIVYRVDGPRVTVLTVFHARRLFPVSDI